MRFDSHELWSLLLLVLATAGASIVAAQGQAVLHFDLPAQPLAATLNAIATASNTNVGFSEKQVIGLRAPALRADITADQALRRVLAKTNLRAVHIGTRTVVLETINMSETPNLKQQNTPNSQDKPSSPHIQLPVATPPDGQSRPTEARENGQPQVLEEIVVTGSRLPVTQEEGPQEVQIYTREKIDESGQNTVTDFLSTLPSVSLSTTQNNVYQSPGFGATVSLRGLPFGTTLVLINGRRISASGTNASTDTFNLNFIPLSAVERIEVVPSGSSAIYGSDAIAGVINIIMKSDFDGVDLDAKYGAASGTHESVSSVAWGKQWDRASASIVGTYQVHSELSSADRVLTATNDYTQYGGPNNNFPVCRPGNVFSVSGEPLPGAPAGTNATYAAVRATGVSSGKPELSNFEYGQLNTCPFISHFSLIPRSERGGIFAQGAFTLTPATTMFAELLYSHVRQDISEGTQFLFGIPGFQSYSVGPANPFNPFGTTVGIATSIPGIPGGLTYDSEFVRPVVGIRGAISATWNYEASAAISRDWTVLTEPNAIVGGGLQNALNSSDPDVALNPFVNGPLGSSKELRSFFTDGREKLTGSGGYVNGFVRGEPLRLPAGPVAILLGAEYSREHLYSDAIITPSAAPNTIAAYGRTAYAIFSEARVPILNATDRDGFLSALGRINLTVAGRYDHYGDFGGKSTPQFGVEWRPLPSLLVRGAYAEAFKAPSLPDVYAPQVSDPAIFVTDPATGQKAVISQISGGNPRLAALTGASRSFGIVYSSGEVAGTQFQFAVTHWSISEKNAIQSVGSQFIVDNADSFPGRVIRDANGMITEVIDTEVNFGSINVAGLDYALAGKIPTNFGEFAPSVSVTQTYRYEEALVPGTVPVSGVSRAQDSNDWSPRWKGTIALGWKLAPVKVNLAARYVGEYQDYDSAREIGNFWLMDANFRWELGRPSGRGSRYLDGLYVELGGTNLFDNLPKYSSYAVSGLGYDPAEADIVGRFLYGRVGVKW